MKKKFGMMALVMILTAGMLAGCGSEQAAESSDGQDAVTGAITVSAAASLTDVLNELAQTFQEEYPGTEVSFTFGGSGRCSCRSVLLCGRKQYGRFGRRRAH